MTNQRVRVRVRVLTVAVAACAAVLMLSACGGGGSTGNASNSGETTHPVVTAAASTTSTTAKPKAASITGVDFRNYTYQDRVCDTKKSVHFTNGAWRQDPTSTINFCGMSINAIAFADVTGDGTADAIVTGVGDLGGGTALSQVTWTTVFRATPTGPVNLGYFDGEAFPPYSTAAGITVWARRLGPNDPACCPTSYLKTTYKYSSAGRFASAASALVPASELPTSGSTPTTVAPTTTSPPAESPPCTLAVLQAAVNRGRPADDQLVMYATGFRCTGVWAVAFPDTVMNDEITVLLHWDGRAWDVDGHADVDCNNTLPAPIYPDCFSN